MVMQLVGALRPYILFVGASAPTAPMVPLPMDIVDMETR